MHEKTRYVRGTKKQTELAIKALKCAQAEAIDCKTIAEAVLMPRISQASHHCMKVYRDG